MAIFAKRALLDSGWAASVRVALDRDKIGTITPDAAARNEDVIVDTLLPAGANLHSHSFQRAMAGLTEIRTGSSDSFWSWRQLMYRFLERLTPDHVTAIAAQSFMEMQKAGYASVGEFHYLHHQPGGKAYDDVAELSCRILEAASDTGIGLTLLPVLYCQGGADGRPVAGGQLRFANDADRFSEIVARAQTAVAGLPADCRTGIAPHSLRAVGQEDLARTLARHGPGPVHIHVAEQVQEIDEVMACLGERPVQWLLDNAEVNARWCLIHATHMTAGETRALAASGAVAGLCPVTEANLGDGIFNGPEYLAAGGRFGVGTDSNVCISLTDELRLLEYGQRLRRQARNVMVDGPGSVGGFLYPAAASGGARALGRDAGRIATGALADLVAVDTTGAEFCGYHDAHILDGLIFAAPNPVIRDLWSAGRHKVSGGTHVDEARISERYRAAIRDLLGDA